MASWNVTNLEYRDLVCNKRNGVVKLGDKWPTAELVELEVFTGGEVLVKWGIGK